MFKTARDNYRRKPKLFLWPIFLLGVPLAYSLIWGWPIVNETNPIFAIFDLTLWLSMIFFFMSASGIVILSSLLSEKVV